MHVPDGFLNAPTSVATAVSPRGPSPSRSRSRARELDERTAPLAGLTAAFIFAVQMLNFPWAWARAATSWAGRWRPSWWVRGRRSW